MHYLRWRARRAQDRIDPAAPQAILIDEAETDLRRVSVLKRQLVIGALPLLMATMHKRLGHEPTELEATELAGLCSAMLAALSMAVDRFDPFHGGRLAAPAGLALDRALVRWRAAHPERQIEPGRARRALPQGSTVGLIDTSLAAWEAWLDLPPRLAEAAADLPQPQRELLSRRFGLGGGLPQTLGEIAGWLDLPRMHAARMEQEALATARGIARSTMPP